MGRKRHNYTHCKECGDELTQYNTKETRPGYISSSCRVCINDKKRVKPKGYPFPEIQLFLCRAW